MSAPGFWPGPQLPFGEPKPIELPFTDRHRRGLAFSEEESESGSYEEGSGFEDEDSVFENLPRPPNLVDEACSPRRSDTAPPTPDESDNEKEKKMLLEEVVGEGGGKSFQRLLLEIAAEHRRALAKQRRELMEDGVSPKPSGTAEPRGESRRAGGRDEGEEDRPVCWGAEMSAPKQQLLEPPACEEKSSPTRLARLGSHHSWQHNEAERLVSQKSVRLSPFDFASETSAMNASRRPITRRGDSLRRIKSILLMEGDTSLQNVLSHIFKFLCTCAILLNCMTIGWAADTAVSAAVVGDPPEESTTTKYLSLVFVAFFTVEILLRARQSGLRNYFIGEDWSWNIFDLVIVGTDVVQSLLELFLPEMVGGNTEGGVAMQNLTVVRVLRILRITRALRVLRIVRFFREFRMMVLSVLQSGSSLLWSCVLLGVTIYAFAVYFIQVVAFHLDSPRGRALPLRERQLLEELFGSIVRAEYSLYMAVSGGISWGEVARPLMEIGPMHGLVFCFYTFFTTFALMNIITGIFVETSISSARSSQEELAQEQLDTQRGLQNEMRKIFERADVDKSGSLNLAEFEVWLDSQENRPYLEALGVEIDKAKGLFELLDLDLSGEITLEEFTFGCLRLKGGARSIDIATLMNHTRRMAEQWREFFKFTDEQFHRMQDFEERLEQRLSLLFDDDAA